MNNTTQQPSTVITNCLYCNKEFSFYPRSKGYKYCSRQCASANLRIIRVTQKVTTNCKICNKEFSFFPSKKANYCSRECYATSKKLPSDVKQQRLKEQRAALRKKNKAYHDEWYQQNKKKLAKRAKELRQDPERRRRSKEYQTKRRQVPEQIQKLKEYYRVYNEENKDRRNECVRALYRKNIKRPEYKIMVRLRNRLYSALKAKNAEKQLSAITLIGCSIEEFKKHIESQWLEGMTWTNHTVKGWHIDHIMPCNTFDLTNLEEQKKCFHYTNLRPLWYLDNITRPHDGSDALPGTQQSQAA